MNVYALPPIIAAIAYFLVGLFVYSKKRPNPVNQSFAIMLLCVSLWNVEWAGLMIFRDPELVYLWGLILRVPVLFIPPTFLHFAFLFTHPAGLSRRRKRILLFFYGISCFLVSISWTRLLIVGLVARPWGYSFKGGPLYVLFLFQFIFAVLIAFVYLIREYNLANSYQKHRLKYFFLAIGVSFTLGSLNFLPVFGLGVYPVGSIVVCIGLFIAAYSVVQHRLMDVNVFMAKTLSYILSLMLLAIPFFFLIILLEDFFYTRVDFPFAIILILLGFAAILIFNFLKVRMDRAMQQIIVRDKYRYHEILDEFGRRLVTIMDLNRLLQMLADTVEKGMGVQQVSIFLFDSEKETFRRALIHGSPAVDEIRISDPGVQYLLEKKEALLKSELEENKKDPKDDELARIMGQFQAEVFLPLIHMNRLIGFMNLGHKAEEMMYYTEDLNLLTSLANQVAIAIENANLYANLKKSQGVMRRADRLASLGTLIASLAHEIRNPLVSIKTFTQLLPERMEDEEFRNYFLKVASGEIDRLTSLINELLGFARPSEPRLEGEDVDALIDKMEVLVATEARKKNVSITKSYAPDLPQVKIDAEQIKQVLLNILLNAIQAIPGEGEIWIETRLVQVPLEERTDPFIQIEIRDTGVGIPQENLERIFDPFFSTRAEGSGLGLAISHQIVNDHGGFITVDSEVGKGTSFKVNLPLTPGGKVGSRK